MITLNLNDEEVAVLRDALSGARMNCDLILGLTFTALYGTRENDVDLASHAEMRREAKARLRTIGCIETQLNCLAPARLPRS